MHWTFLRAACAFAVATCALDNLGKACWRIERAEWRGATVWHSFLVVCYAYLVAILFTGEVV